MNLSPEDRAAARALFSYPIEFALPGEQAAKPPAAAPATPVAEPFIRNSIQHAQSHVDQIASHSGDIGKAFGGDIPAMRAAQGILKGQSHNWGKHPQLGEAAAQIDEHLKKQASQQAEQVAAKGAASVQAGVDANAKIAANAPIPEYVSAHADKKVREKAISDWVNSQHHEIKAFVDQHGLHLPGQDGNKKLRDAAYQKWHADRLAPQAAASPAAAPAPTASPPAALPSPAAVLPAQAMATRTASGRRDVRRLVSSAAQPQAPAPASPAALPPPVAGGTPDEHGGFVLPNGDIEYPNGNTTDWEKVKRDKAAEGRRASGRRIAPYAPPRNAAEAEAGDRMRASMNGPSPQELASEAPHLVPVGEKIRYANPEPRVKANTAKPKEAPIGKYTPLPTPDHLRRFAGHEESEEYLNRHGVHEPGTAEERQARLLDAYMDFYGKPLMQPKAQPRQQSNQRGLVQPTFGNVMNALMNRGANASQPGARQSRKLVGQYTGPGSKVEQSNERVAPASLASSEADRVIEEFGDPNLASTTGMMGQGIREANQAAYGRPLTEQEQYDYELTPIRHDSELPGLAKQVAEDMDGHVGEYLKPENESILSNRLKQEHTRKIIGHVDHDKLIAELRKQHGASAASPPVAAQEETDAQSAPVGDQPAKPTTRERFMGMVGALKDGTIKQHLANGIEKGVYHTAEGLGHPLKTVAKLWNRAVNGKGAAGDAAAETAPADMAEQDSVAQAADSAGAAPEMAQLREPGTPASRARAHDLARSIAAGREVHPDNAEKVAKFLDKHGYSGAADKVWMQIVDREASVAPQPVGQTAQSKAPAPQRVSATKQAAAPVASAQPKAEESQSETPEAKHDKGWKAEHAQYYSEMADRIRSGVTDPSKIEADEQEWAGMPVLWTAKQLRRQGHADAADKLLRANKLSRIKENVERGRDWLMGRKAQFSRAESSAIEFLLAMQFSDGAMRQQSFPGMGADPVAKPTARPEAKPLQYVQKQVLAHHIRSLAHEDRDPRNQKLGRGFLNADRLRGVQLSQYEDPSDDHFREMASILSRHMNQVDPKHHKHIEAVASQYDGPNIQPTTGSHERDVINSVGQRAVRLTGVQKRHRAAVESLKQSGAKVNLYDDYLHIDHKGADQEALAQGLAHLRSQGVHSFSRAELDAMAVVLEFTRVKPSKNQMSMFDEESHPREGDEHAPDRRKGEFAKKSAHAAPSPTTMAHPPEAPAPAQVEASAGDVGDLLVKSSGLIAHIGRKFGYRDSDLDDFIADVQTRVWKHRDSFDATKAKFSTWLHVIATNVAHSKHQKSSRRNARAKTVSIDAAGDDGSTMAANLKDTHRQSIKLSDEQHQHIHRALMTLPASERDAFVGVHVNGQSASDYADERGISRQAVSGYLKKATETMRKRLLATNQFSRVKPAKGQGGFSFESEADAKGGYADQPVAPVKSQKSFGWDESKVVRVKSAHDQYKPGEFAPKNESQDAAEEAVEATVEEKPQPQQTKQRGVPITLENYGQKNRWYALATLPDGTDVTRSDPDPKEARRMAEEAIRERGHEPQMAGDSTPSEMTTDDLVDHLAKQDAPVEAPAKVEPKPASNATWLEGEARAKHIASLVAKMEAKGFKGASVTDVTPDGYGPSGGVHAPPVESKPPAPAAEPLKSKPKSKPAEPEQPKVSVDGVVPGLEPEKPNETPREAAERQQQVLDADYEFARQSTVRNAGEDLKGSARHKRNAWKGLDEAEQDGTAAEIVTRDNLLKLEPHGLMVEADKNPMTALAGHYALRAFPPKPGHGNERQRGRVGEEEAKKDRKQFVETYKEFKAKIESLAREESDPLKAVASLKDWVKDKIHDLRGVGKAGRSDYMAQAGLTGTDRYNNTANALCDTLKNLSSGRGAPKTSVTGNLLKFSQFAKEKYEDALSRDSIVDHVKDIIEGRSLPQSFGKKGSAKEVFNAADAYVKVAKRTGGRDVSKLTSNPNEAATHILKKFGAKGVQWGNSVTDDERVHHAAKLIESLSDLADVTGLKPEDLGLGGRVGWAIGARGHGTASAHYEPSSGVINLTRKSGVGALAHEWGHAFDHSHTGFKTNTDGGDYMVEHTSPERFAKDEHGGVKVVNGKAVTENLREQPTWKAYDDLRKAWVESGYAKRLSGVISQHLRDGILSKAKAQYWGSGREKFARSFERYVQHKLKSDGRENTYLSGLADTGETSMWPNDAEIAHMAPHFEALLSVYRKEKYGDEKAQEFSRAELFAALRTLLPGVEFARKSASGQLGMFAEDEIAAASSPTSKVATLKKKKNSPAAGQKSFWKAEDHPREGDQHAEDRRKGEFAKKESDVKSPATSDITDQYPSLKEPAESATDAPQSTIRGEYEWKKNVSDKWAWHKGDAQITGAFPAESQADHAFQAHGLSDEAKPDAKAPSMKGHPEYDRLNSTYGKLSAREIVDKISSMSAEIKELQHAGRNEFNGMGGRRTSAAVSNEGAREVGHEKLLLSAYAKEKFPEPKPDGITDDSLPPQNAKGKTMDEWLEGGVATDSPAREPVEPASAPAPEAPVGGPMTLDTLAEHQRRINAGETTAAEVKQWFEDVHTPENQESIRAEFAKKSVADLKEMGARGHYGHEKKADLIDSLVRQVADQYNVSGSLEWGTTSGQTMKEALRAQVHSQTDDHIKARAERIASESKELADRATKRAEAIVKPETLDDFKRAAIAAGGYSKLPEDQLIAYDELASSTRREQESASKAKVTGFSGGTEATGATSIVEGHHKKQDKPTFTVTIEKRLDGGWGDVANRAKQFGGNYVNPMTARMYGATPGFQFFNKDAAEKFQKSLGGEEVDRSSVLDERNVFRIDNASERLTALAQLTKQRAEEKLNAPRQSNTHRRAEAAAYAQADARHEAAKAATMQRIAEGLGDGSLKHLNGIRAKTHVEAMDSMLSKAKYAAFRKGENQGQGSYEEMKERDANNADIAHAAYPFPSIWASHLSEHIAAFAEVPGLKKLAASLKKSTDKSPYKKKLGKIATSGGKALMKEDLSNFHGIDGLVGDKAVRLHASTDPALLRGRHPIAYSADGGHTWGVNSDSAVSAAIGGKHGLDLMDPPRDEQIKISAPSDIGDIKKAIGKLKRNSDPRLRRVAESLGMHMEDYDRLQAMDIKSTPELRAALREYAPLKKRQDKEDPIKTKERALVGTKIPDFFPTPRHAIDKMLAAADIQPGMSVLEPSAGKGDILDAIKEQHPEAKTIGIEQHSGLRELVGMKGHEVSDDTDFMEHQGQYDRIVMNPPFGGRQDVSHVQHAFEQLKPGGKLVAIMSAGPFGGSSKKDQEFRDWIEEVGADVEDLPDGTFSGDDAFRKTGVSTRMVVIEKPDTAQFSRDLATAHEFLFGLKVAVS